MIEQIVLLDDTEQRIDRYLRKQFPSASPGFIQKLLRTNKIKVNGERVKVGDFRLTENDTITLYITDDAFAIISKEREGITVKDVNNDVKDVKYQVEGFKKSILYEDEDILCINKPAGINVHPGDHKTTEVSLIQLAEDYIKESSKTRNKNFIALVHRIDRDTSGVLLFAKNRLSLNFLLEELQSHKIEKIYTAICIGAFDNSIKKITAPLLRREVDAGAKVIVSPQGQKAITHVTLLKTNSQYSLIQAQLETGRMHQIRVHLAHVGNPIAGDKNYGNKEINREILKQWGIGRQLLHAKTLTFIHPKTKKPLTLTAPIPPEFKNIFPDKELIPNGN